MTNERLIFLVFCAFPILLFSQESVLIDDFEGGLKSWSAVNDESHLYFEIVDNPSPDSENMSARVLKCTRKAGSVSWAGVILRGVYTYSIDSDTSGYAYASVKFKKTSRGQVSFKAESGPDAATYESTMDYPNSLDWVTMTFDLRGAGYGDYSDFFVMVDRAETASSDMVVYIDDVTLYKEKTLVPEPVDQKAQLGTGEADGYRLVWQDLFDDRYLDPSVWNVENRGDGGGNNELQYYTAQNVQEYDDNEGNGCLVITAKKENYSGKNVTSGRLNTQGKMRFQYGKLEASIKLPKTANGLWPAFWMLGDDIYSNPWPGCGEIDVLEMGHSDAFATGRQELLFNGACHWGAVSNGSHPNYSKFSTWPYSLQDGNFHLFTLYWSPNSIEMYVDRDLYPKIEPYYVLNISDESSSLSPGRYFHHSFFVVFNLAVGGDFPSIYNVNEITALSGGEAKMYVNYVKLYQQEGEFSGYEGPILMDAEEIEASESEMPGVLAGAIYDASGVLLARFDNGEGNWLRNLVPGLYLLKFEDGSVLKVRKR